MATFGPLGDAEFLRSVGGGLMDSANRGVAATIGAPVDTFAAALNLLIAGGGAAAHGLGLINASQLPSTIDAPVGASEWIGRLMQDAGMVSSNRNPIAEALMAALLPGSMAKAGPKVFAAEEALARNAATPNTLGPRAAQRGVLNVGAPWYHGTDNKFDSFDLGKFGEGAFKNLTLGRSGRQPAIYLSDNPSHAAGYGENVMQVNASMKGAYKINAKPEMTRWAKENGYKTPQSMIDDYYEGDAYDALGIDGLLDRAIKSAVAEGKKAAVVDFGDLLHKGKKIGKIAVVADPAMLNVVGPK